MGSEFFRAVFEPADSKRVAHEILLTRKLKLSYCVTARTGRHHLTRIVRKFAINYEHFFVYAAGSSCIAWVRPPVSESPLFVPEIERTPLRVWGSAGEADIAAHRPPIKPSRPPRNRFRESDCGRGKAHVNERLGDDVMPIHSTYRDIAENGRNNSEDTSPRFPLQETDDHAYEPDQRDRRANRKLCWVVLVH